MARFKLVRIGKKEKRRVEVKKVKFRIHLGALIFALICAFLVWFYVKGSTYQAPEQSTETTEEESTSEESFDAESSDITDATMSIALAHLYEG